MDRAYEDNETLQLALDFGFIPVVPPRPQRLEPWQYDKAMYRRRNEIERLFRRLKGFRRIFSRFDKLDLVFLAFLHFALIVEALRYLNRDRGESHLSSPPTPPYMRVRIRRFGGLSYFPTNSRGTPSESK